jgi:chromosome segregation ATPase
MSNAVALLTHNLARSRAETVAARARGQDFEARLAASDAQTASLKGRLEELAAEIQSLKVEVAQTRSNATELQSARFDLANEVECLKIEKSELARQWNDSRALRLQLHLLKSHTPFIALEPDDSVKLLSVPK